MKNNLTAVRSITIDAPASKVWDALINPELIKQYLFGTTASSDWKEGSAITYKGNWEGKDYEDKGVIKKLEAEKLFQSTYWSSMSGKEDKPENYATVTYELSDNAGGTELTVTQDNIENEEGQKHMEQNWEMVIKKLKEVVEK